MVYKQFVENESFRRTVQEMVYQLTNWLGPIYARQLAGSLNADGLVRRPRHLQAPGGLGDNVPAATVCQTHPLGHPVKLSCRGTRLPQREGVPQPLKLPPSVSCTPAAASTALAAVY